MINIPDSLNNSYFIMRHGQSIANVEGIVLSGLEDGKKQDYTLTSYGEEQARQSVTKSRDNGELDKDVIVISSPFSRALKTAEIAKEVLNIENDIAVDERLRERNFGNWEKTSNDAYEKVWTKDKEDPDHKTENVESARETQERAMTTIYDLESQYTGKTILLISHGDTLQILQTAFADISPSEHRSLPHLGTAEIRQLKIKES